MRILNVKFLARFFTLCGKAISKYNYYQLFWSSFIKYFEIFFIKKYTFKVLLIQLLQQKCETKCALLCIY